MSKTIIVTHRMYGCDTGCCGHVVEVDGDTVGEFNFGHPIGTSDEEIKEFVRDMVTKACGAEHIKDIDWDNCIVVDD